jgi:hypothetical protein
VLIPRVVAISVLVLALATSAFAQTAQANPNTPTPSTPSSSLQDITEHPDWFTSHKPYRPSIPAHGAYPGEQIDMPRGLAGPGQNRS